ncbi:MAG: (d)CMP kinase [Firmicutes bacterium]|nr:(d)CMP kinase [Bacillota bacterium]MCL5971244.1 (d)CMP kinase [Bacillota bacterium]
MTAGSIRQPIIAVDGPAGAGKSTVARKLAERLGLLYMDTGAMYRGLAHKALRHGVDLRDESSLEDLLTHTVIDLYRGRDGQTEVLVDGENVTPYLRTPEVNASVSVVAGYPSVRVEMVRRLRKLAEHGGVVMDGRDIGTYVLPEADVKFFLTASLEARARRRQKDLARLGYQVAVDVLAQEIDHRDRLDSTRAVAPLARATDAVMIDTTNLEVDHVVDEMLSVFRRVVGE